MEMLGHRTLGYRINALGFHFCLENLTATDGADTVTVSSGLSFFSFGNSNTMNLAATIGMVLMEINCW